MSEQFEFFLGVQERGYRRGGNRGKIVVVAAVAAVAVLLLFWIVGNILKGTFVPFQFLGE